MNSLFRAYGIRIHTSAITPIQNIGGMTDESIELSPQVERFVPDGGIHPTRNIVRSIDPNLQFTTSNVDSAIDAIGVLGQCIKGTTGTHEGVEMFLQKLDECEVSPLAGAVHRKMSVLPVAGDADASGGLIYPMSLSCEHRGDAAMQFAVVPKSINGALNLAIEDDQALPVITDNRLRYTLGKVTIDGYQLQNLKGIQVDFGVQLMKESAESSIVSEFIGIDQVLSMITFRGIDPKWLEVTAGTSIGSIPIGGKAIGHADTGFYLRRRGETSDVHFEPDGDSKHIHGTMAGLAVVSNVSVSGRQPSETVLQIYTEWDGINLPIVLNTGQQIV